MLLAHLFDVLSNRCRIESNGLVSDRPSLHARRYNHSNQVSFRMNVRDDKSVGLGDFYKL